MIKRVFWVSFYTGASQLLALYTLSYVLRNYGEEVSGRIGIIDSLVLIISGVISFGTQLAVNRNVATKRSWRSNYYLGQSARFSMSLVVIIYAIVSAMYQLDLTKLIFLAAPLIAFNGDYSLYGTGQPIKAAQISFFRIAIPNLSILITAYFFSQYLIHAYLIFVGVGIFNSGIIASRINKVQYLFPFNRKFTKFYLKYYKVGIFQLSYAILITGILAISKFFYTIETIGLVYGVLKYFEVFKGLLRILKQAFFRDLASDAVGIRVDKFGILMGSFVVIPAFLYTKETLQLIYADTYMGKELLLILFGIAMILASLQPSLDMRALLKRLDNTNLFAYLLALIIAVTIISYASNTPYGLYGIPIGIIAGEIILLVVLSLRIEGLSFYIKRFQFILKLLPLLSMVILIRFLFEPSIIMLVISSAIYSLSVLFAFRKLLFEKATQMD